MFFQQNIPPAGVVHISQTFATSETGNNRYLKPLNPGFNDNISAISLACTQQDYPMLFWGPTCFKVTCNLFVLLLATKLVRVF